MGVNELGILREGEVMHFGISEGIMELKYGCRPWLGMDIFWNHPFFPSFFLGKMPDNRLNSIHWIEDRL